MCVYVWVFRYVQMTACVHCSLHVPPFLSAVFACKFSGNIQQNQITKTCLMCVCHMCVYLYKSWIYRHRFPMLTLSIPCCCFYHWKQIWHGPHTHIYTFTVHAPPHKHTLRCLWGRLYQIVDQCFKENITLSVSAICKTNPIHTHIEIIYPIFVSPRSFSFQ